MVTLGQTMIWIGAVLLGLFVLVGYIVPVGILIYRRITGRDPRAEDTEPIRVSLLSIRGNWRTAFSCLFVLQTTAMTSIWTLADVSSSHTYTEISKLTAGNMGLAAPSALILAYTLIEGFGGIMVIWDYYQELKKREEARKEAEIRASLEAEMEARIEAGVQARTAEAKDDVQAIVDAEVKARVEAAIKASMEDEIQARVDAELQRLRNGSAE